MEGFPRRPSGPPMDGGLAALTSMIMGQRPGDSEETVPLLDSVDEELGLPSQSARAPSLPPRAHATPLTDAAQGQVEANASGLASATRWMEQNVPFVVLLFVVFVFEHYHGARRRLDARRAGGRVGSPR